MIPEQPCEQCEKLFTPKRPHGRFCSDGCRYEHWLEAYEQRAAQRVRRLSKDGYGTWIYVVASELIDLYAGRVPESVSRKAWKAMERVRG